VKNSTRVAGAPNAADGYSGDGLSVYTREVARREPTPRMQSRSSIKRIKGRSHTLPELIASVAESLAHLRGQLHAEDDKARRERLQHNIQIKLAFLDKLKLEARTGG
jgi:hypothetical protein